MHGMLLILSFFAAASPTALFKCIGMPEWDGMVPGAAYERNVLALYGAGYHAPGDIRIYTNAERKITVEIAFTGTERYVQFIHIASGFVPSAEVPPQELPHTVARINPHAGIWRTIGLGAERRLVRRQLGKPAQEAPDRWLYQVGRCGIDGEVTFHFRSNRVVGIDLNLPLD